MSTRILLVVAATSLDERDDSWDHYERRFGVAQYPYRGIPIVERLEFVESTMFDFAAREKFDEELRRVVARKQQFQARLRAMAKHQGAPKEPLSRPLRPTVTLQPTVAAVLTEQPAPSNVVVPYRDRPLVEQYRPEVYQSSLASCGGGHYRSTRPHRGRLPRNRIK